MKVRERRQYDMLLRTDGFSTERSADYPTGTQLRELFDIIPETIQDVEKHNSIQTASINSSQSSTMTRAKIRKALQINLVTIKRTATVMMDKIKNLEDKFHLPSTTTDLALLTQARQFAVNVEPFKDQFISYLMPKDFFETLQANILAMEQVIENKNSANSAKVSATVSIKASLTRGVAAVRKADPLIKNLYRDDPGTLAAWATASHVARTARTAKPKSVDTPAPAAVVEPEKTIEPA